MNSEAIKLLNPEMVVSESEDTVSDIMMGRCPKTARTAPIKAELLSPEFIGLNEEDTVADIMMGRCPATTRTAPISN